MIGLIVVNLRRRRARTLLTALGIAIGVATIVALLSLTAGLRRSAAGLADLGKADVGLFQANVGDLTSSALPESMVPRLRAQPGVVDVSPAQLVTGALSRQPDFLLFGLEPSGFVARRLVITAGRRARGDEVMLGDTATRHLGLHLGDSLTFHQATHTVVGIYHSGVSFEDEGAVVSLALAQRLTGRRGEVTTIALSISPTTKASTMTRRLQRAYPGTIAISDPDQLARASTNTLLIDKAVVVIAVLSIVIGAISVTNTMVLTVSERQGELGLLAAVGGAHLRSPG
jgi:ABC-type lipoprotein release transport system permease subunit